MRNVLIGLAFAVAVTGCGEQSPGQTEQEVGAPAIPLPGNFEDVPVPAPQPGEDWSILQAQVALDRAGFSPGVIDGKDSPAYQAALRSFQERRGLSTTGTLDEATRAALPDSIALAPLRSIRLTEIFLNGPFSPNLPRKLSQQAGLPHLGYRNAMEKLAERFHTTPEFLLVLNSGATTMKPGAIVRVPNIPDAPSGGDEKGDLQWTRTLSLLGVPAVQPQAGHVEVSKSESLLKVFDKGGQLISQFPATTGSDHDPLPVGEWTIKGVSRNPRFHYNPDLFWDASSKDKKGLLGPGPNNPVGVAWIDLSKPHYGIHGTPEPALIGKTESHGCIRLTNWDAARLAQMVSPGTRALFNP